MWSPLSLLVISIFGFSMSFAASFDEPGCSDFSGTYEKVGSLNEAPLPVPEIGGNFKYGSAFAQTTGNGSVFRAQQSVSPKMISIQAVEDGDMCRLQVVVQGMTYVTTFDDETQVFMDTLAAPKTLTVAYDGLTSTANTLVVQLTTNIGSVFPVGIQTEEFPVRTFQYQKLPETGKGAEFYPFLN